MPTVELTRNRLAALLQEAADAYQAREDEGRVPEATWAEWCAQYVMDELGVDEDHDESDDVDVLGG